MERIGPYRAERVIGSGSFATVWLAYDERLDSNVAIKVLAENWSLNEDIRRRFIEEARILWRLDHERIVRVHLVDELPDGRPFFVMDYADRGTLDTRIAAAVQAGRGFAPQEVVDAGSQIAEGLAVAHELHVVHRDLKPSNVLYRSGRGRESAGAERLLLADFGIARQLEAATSYTITAGTPHYMAPEQASPVTAPQSDQRVDIYAAAVIAYEMLTGRVPFPFDSMIQVVQAKLSGPPPPILSLRPDCPASLAAVVERGLDADPARRWESAAEWGSALRDAMGRRGAPVHETVAGRGPALAPAEPARVPPGDAVPPPPGHVGPRPEQAPVVPRVPPRPPPAPVPAARIAPGVPLLALVVGAVAGALLGELFLLLAENAEIEDIRHRETFLAIPFGISGAVLLGALAATLPYPRPFFGAAAPRAAAGAALGGLAAFVAAFVPQALTPDSDAPFGEGSLRGLLETWANEVAFLQWLAVGSALGIVLGLLARGRVAWLAGLAGGAAGGLLAGAFASSIVTRASLALGSRPVAVILAPVIVSRADHAGTAVVAMSAVGAGALAAVWLASRPWGPPRQ